MKKGILAIFTHPEDLLSAVKKIRSLRIKKIDVYSPFPVHGLEEVMGLSRSWIPYITFVVALTGTALAFSFQLWALTISWPVNVGGKPPLSWPAFIPITFEFMVLTSGVTTALMMIVMTLLKDFRQPVLDLRFSNDRFGLFIDERDIRFDAAAIHDVLKDSNAEEMRTIV
ncbi:MAG: hypothetical protein A3I05_02190 [Deltaproteobacteria bacterium RIFCSPLOWO2_02_FULL_44_10]|nr:MAG: hypothetical protein A3C46_08355 [Deltaproteobacteria bacterium RIFCSPHIGHO2_02_FULL_44_16]OGQ47588.1 MAG: hypothetical protein A3I05_02190 [Deltaproteobacteria bacterium RIFCSPLOWO2_02_FULL_44_10]